MRHEDKADERTLEDPLHKRPNGQAPLIISRKGM